MENYTKRVFQFTVGWSPKGRLRQLWYRGVSSASHSLVPKLFRKKTANEQALYRHFKDRALQMGVDREPTTEWEWYFIMQHYGLPTRLLDWTHGALLALYFAVRSHRHDKSPAVWIMDPAWLNNRSHGIPSPIAVPHSGADRYLSPALSGNRSGVSPSPMAILPAHITRRMSVQRSTFTIHGLSEECLSTLAVSDPEARLVKCVIPKRKVGLIWHHLHACGISESTVFPDLESLARESEHLYSTPKDA